MGSLVESSLPSMPPEPPRFQSFSFQIRDRLVVGFRHRNACSLQQVCPEFGFQYHGLTMSDEGTERSVILFNGFRVMLPPILELCYLVNNVPFHQNQTFLPVFRSQCVVLALLSALPLHQQSQFQSEVFQKSSDSSPITYTEQDGTLGFARLCNQLACVVVTTKLFDPRRPLFGLERELTRRL